MHGEAPHAQNETGSRYGLPLKRKRAITAAIVAVACVLAPITVAAPSQATPPIAADPGEIAKWHAITARTVATENGVPVPAMAFYFSLASLAMYDAVVAIEGGYRPYVSQPRAQANASPEVAAATAAYRVLSHYFPSSAEKLATDYAASLADVPNGVGMVHGKRVGEAAAASLIAERGDNGINTSIALPPQSGVGAWVPTPDAFAPMAVAWLGYATPYTLESAKQFPWPGPYAVDSPEYAQDFIEVKTYGAKLDSDRTPAQTEIALFWSAAPPLQLQVAMTAQVAERGMDIAAAAQAFALLNVSVADSQVACWRQKYEAAYWRPVTAIRAAGDDGNDATAADEDWVPLILTPPYPDYPSGHACVMGAASGTFSHLFGAESIDLDVFSAVTGTTRHFDSAVSSRRRDDERAHLARNPLPKGDDRRKCAGPCSRGMGAHPLFPGDRLTCRLSAGRVRPRGSGGRESRGYSHAPDRD